MTTKAVRWLVPLLLIVAVAALPGAAQAAPRWLQNGTEKKLEEGNKFPVLSWGTLQVEASKFGLFECENAIGGHLTDPGKKGAGDAAGEGKIEGWAVYNCVNPNCETLGGHLEWYPRGETKEKVTESRITTPWEVHLVESGAGAFKLAIGNKAPFRRARGGRCCCSG